MLYRPMLLLVGILAAQCALAQENCNSYPGDTVPWTPTITSLLPSSGRIYPPFYGPNGTTTCTPTTPCTLSDMTTPVFVSPQSPVPGFMVWYGSSLCGGLQGPLWWGGNYGWVSEWDGKLHSRRQLV